MKFILATTEPQKVPATITSRCQRYQFKRISTGDIVDDLKQKCELLAVSYRESALLAIASLSDGALRDAHSLLEQCLAFGDQLSDELVSQALGKGEERAIFDLLDALLAQRYADLLDQLRDMYRAGRDIAVILADMTAIVRATLRYSITQRLDDDLALDESSRRYVESRAMQHDRQLWLALLDHILKSHDKVKYAAYPWVAAEMMMLSYQPKAAPVADDQLALSARINRLENQLAKLTSNAKAGPRPPAPAMPDKDAAKSAAPPAAPPEQLNPNRAAGQVQIATKSSNQQTDSAPAATEDAPPAAENGDKAANTLDSAAVQQHWQDYLTLIKKRLISTHALMQETQFVDYQNGVLTIKLSDEMTALKATLLKAHNLTHIKKAFFEQFNEEMSLEIITDHASNDYAARVKAHFEPLLGEENIIIN